MRRALFVLLTAILSACPRRFRSVGPGLLLLIAAACPRRFRSVGPGLLLLIAAACSRPPPDATPEGAIKTWLERMEAQVSDPQETKAAYAMLSKGAHQNLEKRAERASRIEGRRIEPQEMLAQGRFGLRFTPRRFQTTTSGDTASVDVTGDDPTDHAVLHCVKDGPVWRIDLALPELTTLPHRQDNQ